MNLAEYNRVYHPGPRRGFPPPTLVIEAPSITIPVKKLTVIKASVLAGIAVTYFVPPQWAWLSLIPNAYWMYKL